MHKKMMESLACHGERTRGKIAMVSETLVLVFSSWILVTFSELKSTHLKRGTC